MEVFLINSRKLVELLVKFKNNEIEKKIFDVNIILTTAFNLHYFSKEYEKTVEIKKLQDKILFEHYVKESAQIICEKELMNQVRRKQETRERANQIIEEQRSALLSTLILQEDIQKIAEHSYDSYIPPKNLSISIDFHINNFKVYKKYTTKSNTNINLNNQINIEFSEQPYLIDEKNCKEKEVDRKEFDDIMNLEDENILFYSDVNKSEKNNKEWLKDINNDEIKNNFKRI